MLDRRISKEKEQTREKEKKRAAGREREKKVRYIIHSIRNSNNSNPGTREFRGWLLSQGEPDSHGCTSQRSRSLSCGCLTSILRRGPCPDGGNPLSPQERERERTRERSRDEKLLETKETTLSISISSSKHI